MSGFAVEGVQSSRHALRRRRRFCLLPLLRLPLPLLLRQPLLCAHLLLLDDVILPARRTPCGPVLALQHQDFCICQTLRLAVLPSAPCELMSSATLQEHPRASFHNATRHCCAAICGDSSSQCDTYLHARLLVSRFPLLGALRCIGGRSLKLPLLLHLLGLLPHLHGHTNDTQSVTAKLRNTRLLSSDMQTVLTLLQTATALLLIRAAMVSTASSARQPVVRAALPGLLWRRRVRSWPAAACPAAAPPPSPAAPSAPMQQGSRPCIKCCPLQASLDDGPVQHSHNLPDTVPEMLECFQSGML